MIVTDTVCSTCWCGQVIVTLVLTGDCYIGTDRRLSQ